MLRTRELNVNQFGKLNIKLRHATKNDYDFVYQVKVDALKEYIQATWGWDDKQQQDFHHEHFNHEETEIIQLNGLDVGFAIIKVCPNELRIEEINILKKHQNNGIGTEIIINAQTKAKELKIPVWLQVLKVNPAINLYKRMGFIVISTNETHFQMSFG
jgi:ribosomal protein S18 acetylase RimI-like enzyme